MECPPVTLPEQVTCGSVPSGKRSKGEVEIHRKAGGHLGALSFEWPNSGKSQSILIRVLILCADKTLKRVEPVQITLCLSKYTHTQFVH